MTDSILPDDVANGLVDGTVDISSLPADLRGVAELLATAHRPATGAELAGMATAVQQFSAAVTSTSTPAAAIAGATTSGVMSMFGTRITKRAAVIVGATVLFAGTAAAAAGGVLPTPFSSSVRDFTPPALARAATSTDAPESTESTLAATQVIAAGAEAIEDKSEADAETEALDDTTSTLYSGRDFGLCTAWTNGAPKNTAAPAFADLVDEAAAAGMADVDAYCAAVLLDHDATTSTANSTEIETGSSVDDKGGQNNGQNNGGQNNGQNKGGNDPATSVATPPSVSNPSATAPGISVDDNGGQSGKGKGKGGNDTSTSNG